MDRAQQSRIKAFHGLSTILEQRPVEYDRILPSKMVSLGYAVSGTTAVQRLCVATVHCIEEDLLPLRCDHIVQTVREWRPVGILYFFIGSFLLAGLLVVEADQAAFAWVLTRFRAVKLRSPLARWIVLSLGYSRWMVRAYLLPPLAVVAAVSSLLDDGVLEASQIVGVYLSITFILEASAPPFRPTPPPTKYKTPPTAGARPPLETIQRGSVHHFHPRGERPSRLPLTLKSKENTN
jgi:hypothetical protein